MPHDDTPSERPAPRPQFSIEHPSRISMSLNPTMAGDIAGFMLASFQDGDPPHIFAFAKKLEAEARGARSVEFDEDGSHPVEHTAQTA